MTPAHLLESAREAAEAAAEVLRSKARQARPARVKGDRYRDLVTEADAAAEAAILRVLRERHPDHGWLAEEGGGHTGRARVRWIVDPLDGTVNWARRIPHFAVSIAAEDEAGIAAALILDPSRDECFTAVRGGGAFLGEERLRVRAPESLDDAILATGFSYDTDLRRRNAALAARLIPRIRGVRRMGAAALDLAWVAAGRIDGFWEMGLSPWDLAAGVLLVEEAGGVVSGMPSERPPLESGSVVAAAPTLHAVLHDELGIGVS